MWKYIVKRILILIPLIFVVSFLVYALMEFSPGDPVRAVVGDTATPEQVEMMREKLGYNDPLLVRYTRYIANVLHGDFGKSIYGERDVLQQYMSRVGYTLWLSTAAMVITIIVSVIFGSIAAVKHNTWIDTILSAIAMAGISIPGFWFGIVLILLFSLKLGWTPVSGAEQWTGVILPAVTWGLINAAILTRTVRSALLDTLGADYLRTARAKGVKEGVVIYKHAFKNALIPIVTMVGSLFSGSFVGTMIIENVFAWPGIGTLIVTAIRSNDVTLVTGASILTMVLTSVTLLLVDIAYAYIDPRIKSKYTG